jgi:hypothetical protein
MPQTSNKVVDASSSNQEIQSLYVHQEIDINSTVAVAWQALLDELGPESQLPGEAGPFPMKFEAWPGGRWFRDLGNNSGHLWGHVQVIKPPALLEITGQMFMSYAAANHLQYRLKEEGKKTKLTLTHRAFGQIPPDQRENVNKGWGFKLNRIRELAERK